MSDSSAVELISSQEIFKVPSSSTKTIKSAEQDECEDTKLRECGSNGNTKFMENNGTERDSAISGMSIVTPVLNYVQPPWACTPKKGMGYKLEVTSF
uniref:Ovule protein n=1 Tax=Heterorhabditis bacteriophora TaxID=37862 RepID=A0A1I7X999_HETBA